MDKYKTVINYKEEKFKRIVGVTKETFHKMSSLVEEALLPNSSNKKIGGRPRKLSFNNQVLMCLEYLREYRTYENIASSYEIGESSAIRLIAQVENILIQSKEFHLPKRKELEDNLDIEVILIDASEHPIQRPKKSNKDTTVVKRKDTP